MPTDDERNLRTQKVSTSKQEPAGPVPAPRLSLLVYQGEQAQVAMLEPNVGVVVGRLRPADVTIDDTSLSRLHARFTLTKKGVVVEDLGSTNGTHVGGVAVEQATLQPGDRVLLGEVVVTVHELAATFAPGMVSYERFRLRLTEEIVRARFFERPLSVALIASVRNSRRPFHDFWPAVERSLRPVDLVGVYSSDAIEVLLPELDALRAAALAGTIVAHAAEAVSLVAGVATFPDAGTSADELLGACLAASQRATAEHPVQSAPSSTSRVYEPRVEQTSMALPIGESAAMREVLRLAQRAAKGVVPVLLFGETGTGKEVLARFIHDSSPRKSEPMVSINCAAIPAELVESTLFGHERGAFTGAIAQKRGVFESADHGTVFLDEVGDLSLSSQAALLRVLETKCFARVGGAKELAVDVRVIAATHRDLEAMVAEGVFRQDLLYRLNAFVIELPPLRARRDDIQALSLRFLEQACIAGGANVRRFEPEALELLKAYDWPGNARELRNVVERAVVLAQGDSVGVDDLPERVRAFAPSALDAPVGKTDAALSMQELEGDFRTRMEQLEARVLMDALARTSGNQTQAARLLDMPLRTLVHKIKVLGITRPRGDPKAPR